MRDVIATEQLQVGQKVGITHFRGRFEDGATITSLGPREYGIGSAFHYPQLTVRLKSREVVTFGSLGHVFMGEEYERREWCPECRTRSDVVDAFTEGYMARDGEHEFQVVKLDCGHDLVHGDKVIGSAPGAPYAGPGAVVARSTSSRDLTAAHTAAARDPWADA